MDVATYLVEVFAFGIVVLVLWRYVRPLLRKSIAARQAQIKAQLSESRQARERLERAEAAAEQALADAQVEAASIRDEARVQAQHISAELQAKAHEAAERILDQARAQLDTERDALVRELRTAVGRLSVELAGRIAVEALRDEALRTSTIDRFLDQLGDVEPVARPATAAGAGRGPAR